MALAYGAMRVCFLAPGEQLCVSSRVCSVCQKPGCMLYYVHSFVRPFHVPYVVDQSGSQRVPLIFASRF